VVYGNYDTYELLRAGRIAAGMEDSSRASDTKKDRVPVTATTKVKRKRKYPYRKAHELESEIAETEAMIVELEAALVTPEIYRESSKVKETMRKIELAREKLPQLYEHWEEAIELNG
jgi:ATP-binding cassette subfamily F protein 3